MEKKLEEIQETYNRYKELKKEVSKAVSVIVMNSNNKIVAVSRKDDCNKTDLYVPKDNYYILTKRNFHFIER